MSRKVLVLILIIAFNLSGCKGCKERKTPLGPEGGISSKELEKRRNLLLKMIPDKERIMVLISNHLKSSQGMKAPSPEGEVFFSLARIEGYVSPTGEEGYIKYAFLYKEDEKKFEGTIKFKYKWVDDSWCEDGYEIDVRERVTGKIKGRVINAITKSGMEGVVVYGEDKNQNPPTLTQAVKTDASGFYSLENVLIGTYIVYGVKSEFEINFVKGVLVEKGKETLAPEIELLPIPDEKVHGAIVGEVVNLKGEAVEGVLVYLEEEENGEGELPTALTNEAGEYKFTPVREGKYKVYARIENIESMVEVIVSNEIITAPTIVLQNTPPTLLKLLPESSFVLAGETIRVVAEAMDEDGDALNFLWYAGEGSISNQLGRILYWSAPSKLGTCEIKVFVKDNKGGKADGEVEVEVISFIPSPALSPRGLAADGECIWCAAGGKVYRVDPSDGEIISSLTTPGELPRGLAWGDGFLFIADSATDKIYKMDVSSGSFEEYPLPGEDLIPSGLAFDGENLWVSDYDKNALYKLTPDGEVLDKFPSPGSSPRGLTFSEEGYLLGVDSGDDDLVYKIDPLSGEPLTSFSTPSTNPRGLALMDNLLFIADWDKNQIYKMIVDN